MSTTVVIADDHAVVREGIRGLLRIDPGFTVLAEAENGETAILMVREHRPDVLLLDLMMPGMGDAAEAMIGIIRKASPDTHIMILTSSDDDRLAFKAIEAGAHSFLLKSMRGEHLLNAIHAAGKGTPTLHPLVAQRLLHSIRNPQTSQFEDLTVRELEVLRCLAEGGSNAKISAQLNITEKTVKAHLGSIMSKLDLTDRTQAVALAWRAGLMKQ